MTLQRFNKAWAAMLPLAVLVGGWLGLDVTPEWWQAVGAAVAPVLVYIVANKE